MTKIYISSTYSDLVEYRQQAYEILRKMRYDVIAMEDYVATDRRPLEKCLADVASCDLYVGLFAWRYGHIPPGKEQSITELEYQQADESGLERLIFLLDEDTPWPPGKMEKGTGGAKIEALRGKLMAAHTVQLFKSPEDLAGQVAASVAQWEQAQLVAGTDSQLGIYGRVELVEDGKSYMLRAPSGGEVYAGPGLLIVADGYAVVLEQGGRISRIVGAGTSLLKQDERPSLIVPLRSETIAKPITNVITRDGIIIEGFNLFIYFQVDPGSGQPGERSEFAYDENHIKKIWRLVSKEWDSIKPAMETIADTSLRDVIARYDLDEVLATRERIKDEVRAQINKRSLDSLAIRVVGVDIGEVKIPMKAQDALLEKWIVKGRQDIDATMAETERLIAIERRRGKAKAKAEELTQMLDALRQGGLTDEQITGILIEVCRTTGYEDLLSMDMMSPLLPGAGRFMLPELEEELEDVEEAQAE